MSYLKINGFDASHLVKGLKVGYETLVSDNSGRNASGNTVIDVVNKKIKVYTTFRPMDGGEMASLLSAMESYVVTVTFFDSKTNALKTITCYTGTPEPEYYYIHGANAVMYKEMNLNFIEL
jgi:hypothetical protein